MLKFLALQGASYTFYIIYMIHCIYISRVRANGVELHPKVSKLRKRWSSNPTTRPSSIGGCSTNTTISTTDAAYHAYNTPTATTKTVTLLQTKVP
jgi:hypothetical protein